MYVCVCVCVCVLLLLLLLLRYMCHCQLYKNTVTQRCFYGKFISLATKKGM